MVLTHRSSGADTDERILDQVHRQAVRASVQEAARTVHTVLTGRIAAYVIGVKDVKTVTRWANGEVTAIRADSESRLRVAYEIITLLLRFDAPDTVRAWFIGLAPELDDVSPARTIHDGRLQDAIGAARVFVANG